MDLKRLSRLRFVEIFDAAAWRIRRIVGDQRLDGIIVKAANVWRPHLKRTQFIGITGSGGKTTTKELLLGIMSHKQVGIANPASLNVLPEIAKTILRVRPSHDFCITELTEDRPGVMEDILTLLRPSIAIVTVVRDDHLTAYDSREALTREMAKLVAALPSTGTAVLNADDEEVLTMAAGCKSQIITYGTNSKADLRAEGVSSVWPDRLQMTLVHGSERVRLETQLCGTHWLPSVLGAVGGGLAASLTFKECAAGIAQVEPFEGRMQPVNMSDGVTFIRDDFKAPLWTLDACFDFMKAARAKRKIVVIGVLSDFGAGTGASKKYAAAAALAQAVADLTIVIGPWASSALKARANDNNHSLRVFNRVRDAAALLNTIAAEGDLILLKGTNKQDHLQRIILARTNSIACWRDDCQRNDFCNQCPERMKPSGMPASSSGSVTPMPTRAGLASPEIDSPGQVIVGLGNPGAQFAHTPHNVGYDVLDRLAADLALPWRSTLEAMYAQGTVNDQSVCLVKVQAPMNLIGASLKLFANTLHFRPEQCTLIFDDLDLPLGTVKTRQRGSAGSHRGVASILEAFQTDAFRRVKIGVGKADYKMSRAQYVLTQFSEGDQASIDAAIEKAASNIRTMLDHAAVQSSP